MTGSFPWMGGKRRLAAPILGQMPPHTCYVEPFAGSAGILLAREEPAETEILNDLDGELVNFFRVAKHHLLELCNQFRFAVVSRKIFEWLQETPPETLTDVQRAARFFYLQKTCFGGKPTRRTFGVVTSGPPKLNLLRLEEDLSSLHLRLAKVVIENLTWEECLARYDRPHTLFFVDPPYYECAGYASGPMTLGDYERLAEALAGLRGKALLTINSHPEMRRIFDRFEGGELAVRHQVGGGGGRAVRERLYKTWTRKEKP